jgi:hypothetical protein
MISQTRHHRGYPPDSHTNMSDEDVGSGAPDFSVSSLPNGTYPGPAKTKRIKHEAINRNRMRYIVINPAIEGQFRHGETYPLIPCYDASALES